MVCDVFCLSIYSGIGTEMRFIAVSLNKIVYYGNTVSISLLAPLLYLTNGTGAVDDKVGLRSQFQ